MTSASSPIIVSPLGSEFWGIAIIVAIALLAHEPWRWLGAFLGRSLSPQDAVFVWVKAVSTALVAGLVMRLVLFPAGTLASMPLSARLLAVAAGIAGFYLARRNLLAGIVSGCAAMAAATLASQAMS